MASIPKPRIAQPVRPAAPSMAPLRSVADLPPENGYLAREIERLPSAELNGDEDLAVLQDGKARRGNLRNVLALARKDIDKLLADDAKQGRIAGGGGRHTYERSVARATARTADGTEYLLAVKNGHAVRLTAQDVANLVIGGSITWDEVTGKPTVFPPDAHAHTQSDVTGLVSDLALKAPLASPPLTGIPTAPTQTPGNNSTRIATTAYTDAAIAALLDTPPGTLDTLNELAAALGDDPNFATTITASIAGKLAKASNLSDLTDLAVARTNLGLVIGTDVAAQSHVGAGGAAHANAIAAGAAGFMTGADKTKLDGVAAGATANSSDATLLARANHTGTQLASTVSDFSEAVDDRVSSLLVQGTNVTLTYNDAGNTLTVACQCREVLTASRTYYVRTDGSDSNTGLVDSAGGAFLTIQKAINTVTVLDLGLFDVTIDVGDGTYTGALTLKSYVGIGPVTIVGNTTTPANVVLSITSANAITGDGVKGQWNLQGFKSTTITAGSHIVLLNGTLLMIANWDFGATAAGGIHVSVSTSSSLSIATNYTVSGGATDHWLANQHGFITCSGRTITISGSPTFTNWARTTELGLMRIIGNTYSGAVTGTKKYLASMNSVIESGGSTLPGATAGTVATGGQYA